MRVNGDRDNPLGGHPWRPSRPRRSEIRGRRGGAPGGTEEARKFEIWRENRLADPRADEIGHAKPEEPPSLRGTDSSNPLCSSGESFSAVIEPRTHAPAESPGTPKSSRRSSSATSGRRTIGPPFRNCPSGLWTPVALRTYFVGGNVRAGRVPVCPQTPAKSGWLRQKARSRSPYRRLWSCDAIS